MSGELHCLWGPANLLFVRDKYVTPTGKWLHAGYVQKAESPKKRYHLIPQLAANNMCVWFNGYLLHTYHNYFDTTVYSPKETCYMLVYSTSFFINTSIYMYKLFNINQGLISFTLILTQYISKTKQLPRCLVF